MRRFCANMGKAAVIPLGAAVFVLLSCAFPAAAAWTRPQGDWFTAQTISTYRTNHFIAADGSKRRQPAFHKHEWNGYAEYGWREDTTLGLNLFAHQLTVDTRRYVPLLDRVAFSEERNYGLTDSEFFLRQTLWSGTWRAVDSHIALQPLIKLPSFYRDGGTPRSGTDAFDAELRLQTGFSFPLAGRHHFLTADAAYRKRGGAWHNQLKADFTLGTHLSGRFLLLSQLFITEQAGGAGPAATSSATVNDYDLWKAQLSLVYRLNTTTRLQLGGFRHIHARNTGDGDGMLLSVWREF